MAIVIKRALITGITSQDGTYLAKFLLRKGYKVYGTYRKLSSPNFWRLQYLNIHSDIELIPIDITDSSSIQYALKISNPQEVYHLAAQSYVGVSFDQPLYTYDITGIGTARVLDEIRKFNHKIKFYHAASSEMYGQEKSPLKDESTPFHPVSPYAIARVFGYWAVNLHREQYNMFATNGILFNHESSIRGLEYVSRKITNGVAKISLGIAKTLNLGNLSVKRDWGYAPEYVNGMWLMLQQKQADDYILATNESHSIQELAEESCKIAGVSFSKIKSSKKNRRPLDIQNIRGDYSKARRSLGWKPKITFKKMIKIMVEDDINRWERWLKGEQFPWDVPTSDKDLVFATPEKNFNPVQNRI